jgi:hypothetical protein
MAAFYGKCQASARGGTITKKVRNSPWKTPTRPTTLFNDITDALSHLGESCVKTAKPLFFHNVDAGRIPS